MTRFYAIHVFILPVSLTLLMVGHIALFRRHGVTPSPARSRSDLEPQTELFWPGQMLRDVVVAGIVLACLIALTVTVGVSLEAPADPGSGYEARPEWYFLFLFQILKLFEGPLVLLGTVVIPALAVGFLFLVPFLEARTDGPGRPSRRTVVPMVALLSGCALLTAWALRVDSTDESFQAGRAVAEADARLALDMMAEGGMDADGRIRLYEGLRLFEAKGCEACHRAKPEDTPGPLLGGYGSAAYLTGFMRAPDAPGRFHQTVLEGGMEAFEGTEQELSDLVSWLRSLSGRSAGSEGPTAEALARGRGVFEAHDCADCHNPPEREPTAPDWEHDATGPDLRGFLSFEWTRRLIREAGHPVFYGDAIEEEDMERSMPAFGDLRPDELDLLAVWLLAGAPGADTVPVTEEAP